MNEEDYFEDEESLDTSDMPTTMINPDKIEEEPKQDSKPVVKETIEEDEELILKGLNLLLKHKQPLDLFRDKYKPILEEELFYKCMFDLKKIISLKEFNYERD